MGAPSLANVTFALQALLAMFAWTVSRRSREHAGVAGFVSWMVASDAMRRVTVALRGTAPHPLHGVARIAFHVDELLVSSWSFVFVACCAWYFLRSRRTAASVGALWIATWVVMIASYPWLVTARLMVLYQAFFWITLAIAWGTILFAMFRRRELRPGLAHLVLIIYAAADLVVGAFPFLHGFVGRWQDARVVTILMYSVCVLLHVNELFRAQRSGRDVTA
jgi:hypothetical protein